MKTIYFKPETDICKVYVQKEILGTLQVSGGARGSDEDWADSNGSHFDDSFEEELANNGSKLWED